MGNSFALFDVSIVISHGLFHCGNSGHTQNTDFPWVESHYPVVKRSSGTETNIQQLNKGSWRKEYNGYSLCVPVYQDTTLSSMYFGEREPQWLIFRIFFWN